jgi:predicted Zn-dependent peptidase
MPVIAPFARKILLIAASIALLAMPALAEAVAPAKALDVKEVALENGLRIYVVERPATPTFAAIYQFGVGGASDPKGKSGIAHLLEHMMFKGTTTVGTLDVEKEAPLMRRLSELWHELHLEMDKEDDPFREPDREKMESLQKEIEQVSAEQKKLIVKNEYDELMSRAGSVGMNASTGNDVTRYYIQLPANMLELWLKMEADRLLNPVFREFYSERDVVLEERRMRTENTAWGRMSEALQALLYTAHPYGQPVIGWPRDLQRLVREDAMEYFKTYYSPSNCIMVLVGDVGASEVKRLAEKYLGAWERQTIPRLPITSEPEQDGERRRIVEFDAEPILNMAWRTVPEGHPDQYALDVLSMVLGGLYSSRFDETIIQKERLASGAGTGHPTYKYSGYFIAYGMLRGEHDAADLEQAMEREIKKIQEDGISEVELERAKTAVEVSRVESLKSNAGLASWLANAVYFSGSPDYFEEYERRVNAVTAEQVKEAAVKYLQPKRKNVVEVRRVESAGGGGSRGASVAHQRGGGPGERGKLHSTGFKSGMELIRNADPVDLHIPEIGKEVQRVELPSGITLFIKEDHSAPSIEMSFGWLGGSNTAPVEDLAPFELASQLLDEGGTEKLSPTELQARKDELGMSFSVGVGSTLGSAYFWSLKRNFEKSFDLALEILMHPRLDPERLETLRGQYIESMRRRTESPGRAASVLLSHVIYKDHPRLGYVPSKEEIEAITPEKVREIWKRYLGRDNLYMTVVGDFETSDMVDLIESKIGSWKEAENSERRYITHDPIINPGVYVVEKELPQPAVRLYHQIDVDRRAPKEDHAALEILNDILGGSGFRSRLMERLRSDEGLTYGIYSSLSHQGRPGVPGRLRISYQTKKDSVAHSIDSVLEEVHKIIKEKVGEAEVQEQIESWRNRFIFRYTNDFYIVARLMRAELNDRPYDYDRMVLDEVQKVTVKDVRRVAKKYLEPENLTVAIFGTLTEEDRKALDERLGLKVLKKEKVFAGGYEESQPDGDAPVEPSGRLPVN